MTSPQNPAQPQKFDPLKFRWRDGDLVELTDEEYRAEQARRDAEQQAAAEEVRRQARQEGTP